MTTPTLFASAAVAGMNQARSREDGALFVRDSGVYTIASGTAGGVHIGLIPIRKGERLNRFDCTVGDADTGSAITLDLGWTYTDSALSASENVDGYEDGNALINNAGGTISWPNNSTTKGVATNDYIFEGDGFIVAVIRDSGSGGTTTSATIEMRAVLDYGARAER